MWSRILALCCAALLFSAEAAFASDAISLKNGTIYLGRVTEVTDDSVTIDIQFPSKETKQIQRATLTDPTLWRILSSRIAAGDGAARLELGLWAQARGLLVAALTEFRQAAETKELATTARGYIEAVGDELAMELFDRGEEYLHARRPGAALGYFEALLARYPKSDPAAVARKRTALIRQLIREQERSAPKGAPKVSVPTAPAVWERRMASIRKHLARAAKYRQNAVHGRRSVKQTQALKSALRHFEAAWKLARDMGAPPIDVPAEPAEELVARVHQDLVQAYLDLGLSHLLRKSLNQAEENCAKACDLDPEGKSSHTLHARIIEARLVSDWGLSSYGRVSGRAGRRGGGRGFGGGGGGR